MEEKVLERKENEIASNDNNSNKNGIIAILIVIIIALIGAVIYFAFIKKDEPSNDNNGGNNQEINNNTNGNNQQEVENNKYEDNTEYKLESFDKYINDLKNNNDIKNVKYEIHDVVQSNEFEELDGMIDGDVLIKMSTDGEISLKYKDNNSIVKISNISKGKDFVSVLYGNHIYVITENGDVYKIEPNDENYKDKAIKLNNIKNADKFVFVSFEPKDELYISTELGIIDKNNNYIRLDDVTGL